MNSLRMPHMPTVKGKVVRKKLFVPKNTLKELNISEDQFYELWDQTAQRFGFNGRGELLAHLFSPDGDLDIVIRPRKR